ncbi:MAG: hypothetical protein WD972_00495 [Candidatus Andersenbacteria bacterium]
MMIRVFLIGSALTCVVAGIIWVLILYFLDPQQAGSIGYALFFLSLFLCVASLCALIGYGIRRLVSAERLAAYSVRASLRQGIMLGLFLTLLLLLVRIRLYQWWLAVLLTIVFVFAELIFLSYDRTNARRS